MELARSSGVLLHITSLPGGHGIGDLGRDARRYADFLAEAGQGVWQILPLVPTGYGNSPYQGLSVFAGNPLLIDLDELCEQGLSHHVAAAKRYICRSDHDFYCSPTFSRHC